MDSIVAYLPLGLVAATIIIVFYGISQNKKYRARLEYISQRESMLSEQSVDELLSKQRQEKADFEEKQRVGRDYLDKLDKAIEPTTAQLKRIEVGLVPPIFRFDDSEELKRIFASVEKSSLSVLARAWLLILLLNGTGWEAARTGTG
ncbi:hypothetical protein U0358_11215 [Idiomarina sp. PL1-037]|uniref:hypothetical protein n=1 Tax=Idiomarina sp. PL1-037 TaxID=3095365 RepID=UPI002ACC24B8|nr:hypothetical protein [Idiomarina sp. PL1-037]WQC52601.1 hypothetical protein U0358_11215 [Idiomarina sp. PL1-037]